MKRRVLFVIILLAFASIVTSDSIRILQQKTRLRSFGESASCSKKCVGSEDQSRTAADDVSFDN